MAGIPMFIQQLYVLILDMRVYYRSILGNQF